VAIPPTAALFRDEGGSAAHCRFWTPPRALFAALFLPAALLASLAVWDATRLREASFPPAPRGAAHASPRAPGGAPDAGASPMPVAAGGAVAPRAWAAAPGRAVAEPPARVHGAARPNLFDTAIAAAGAFVFTGLFCVLWHARRQGRPGAGLAAEASRAAAAAAERAAPNKARGAGPGVLPTVEQQELGAALARAGDALRQRSASERAAIEALAESEARLRTLADNLPDGLIFQVVPGADGASEPWRFTHISNGVERLHGVPAAAVLADPLVLFRRIAAGHRARFVRELGRAAAERDTFRVELPFRAPRGGGLRWSRLSAAPRTLLDGTTAWDGIEVDITAAKAAESALRQAEERFRGLFEAAPFSIVIVDPRTFGVLAFNDRACGELGYTREEFAGLTLMDIDALGDKAAMRRRARAHTLRPGVQEFEARHRDKRGGVRDVLVRACGVVLDGREVAYTAFHDITERKGGGAALRAGEAEFRAIFETSAAGMTEVDLRTGRYLRVNRRFCEMVGRSEAELTGGLGPDDIRHPDERTSPTSASCAGASPSGRFEGEGRFVRPDGAVVWTRGSVAIAGRDAERAPRTRRGRDQRHHRPEAGRRAANPADAGGGPPARNALAVVRAMVRLTPADGDEARRFAATLEGRVAAMARAHTLLSRDRWAGRGAARAGRGGTGPLRQPRRARFPWTGRRCSWCPRPPSRSAWCCTNSPPTRPSTVR
jgi:PAS domain S-box-containing protein